MRTRTLRACSWSTALLAAAVIVGCDEDRATPVAATPPTTPHPNGPPPPEGEKGPNPISGKRTSAYGKAYDVAEDLVDRKIPDYNKRLEEELDKDKKKEKKESK